MNTNAIVAAAALAVLGFWMLGAYNRLVRLRKAIAASFAKVDALYLERHEMLAELIAVASAEVTGAPEVLAAVDAARRQARIAAEHAARRSASAGRLASLTLAEQVLRTALSSLITLIKARPALRVDARLRSVTKALSTNQNQLSAARQGFNAAVHEYNRSVRQFPTWLVAAVFGFRAAGSL